MIDIVESEVGHRNILLGSEEDRNEIIEQLIATILGWA